MRCRYYTEANPKMCVLQVDEPCEECGRYKEEGDGVKREEILAMEPGRELDVLVGQHVMGLRVDPVVKTHLVAGYDDPEGWADPDSIWEPIPCYSTEIAAAWQVVEHLRDCLHLRGEQGRWEARFCGLNKPGECGHGDTAAEAIVKAALLAVMGSDA